LHLVRHLVEATAHEALDRVDRVLGVRHGLPLGDLADEALPGLRVRDDGRRGAAALAVRDDLGVPALQDGDDAVRRAGVDSDDLAHLGWTPPASCSWPAAKIRS